MNPMKYMNPLKYMVLNLFLGMGFDRDNMHLHIRYDWTLRDFGTYVVVVLLVWRS